MKPGRHSCLCYPPISPHLSGQSCRHLCETRWAQLSPSFPLGSWNEHFECLHLFVPPDVWGWKPVCWISCLSALGETKSSWPQPVFCLSGDDMHVPILSFLMLKAALDVNNVPEFYHFFNSPKPKVSEVIQKISRRQFLCFKNFFFYQGQY